MGLLSKLAELVGYKRDELPAFVWRVSPDPQRPESNIHECMLPGGSYFIVQEVSAPDPERGHIGWLLIDSQNTPVEMRNGFFEVDKAKTHAEGHFRAAYAIK